MTLLKIRIAVISGSLHKILNGVLDDEGDPVRSRKLIRGYVGLISR